ncbi:MAG: glycosyltransferase family 2 protein [Clostridia bacterium]|nr:glycosyltransferase family 2 protein [Clostridia bacterium]
MDKITVVVPCFNEEAVITTFYEKMSEISNRLSSLAGLELLFVDDGSTDGTVKLLEAMSEKDSRVGYISFSRNFGKEAALLAGLEAADGDFVAVMDVDMQDPPEYLVQMYHMLTEDSSLDCVAAKRTTRAGEPKVRSFFARRFYKLINRISDTKIVDGARDFRMMRRDMAEAVVALGERCRFSKGIFSWVGFNTGWIEFENTERAAGDTKWSFFGLFAYALEGIMAFTTVPMCLPFIAAGVCFVLFPILALLAAFLQVSGVLRLLLGVSAVAMLCTGMIMTSLGVLGGYMSKMYREVKARPMYIVRRRGGICSGALMKSRSIK